MNKIIIKTEVGNTSIILNGMKMTAVTGFSLTKDIGQPAIFSIEMLLKDAEIETE